MLPVRMGTEYGNAKEFAMLSTGTGHFQKTEVRNKYGYGQFLKIIIRRWYGYEIVFGDLLRVRLRVRIKFDFQLRVRNPYPYQRGLVFFFLVSRLFLGDF